jgi:hypothetical protein
VGRELGGSQDIPEELRQVVRVTLAGGETHALDPAAVSRVRGRAGSWLEQRRREMDAELLRLLEDGSEAAFARAAERVPAFADWYYSLSGEYARLLHAALGELDDHLAGRLEELVLAPAAVEGALEDLARRADGRLEARLRRMAAELLALVEILVRAESLAARDSRVEVLGEWRPGGDLPDRLMSLLSPSPDDLARQGVATSAGVVAAALAFKKLGAAALVKASGLAAAKPTAGALAALASKLGLKTALQGGGGLAGAGAGAAAGATLCAGTLLGAPLAPGCALLGGALTGLGTWLLVDKAVLEVDEHLHRERLEAELRAALEAQRRELVADLADHYSSLSARAAEALEAGTLGAADGAP